jgi:hypothetical protein
MRSPVHASTRYAKGAKSQQVSGVNRLKPIDPDL